MEEMSSAEYNTSLSPRFPPVVWLPRHCQSHRPSKLGKEEALLPG